MSTMPLIPYYYVGGISAATCMYIHKETAEISRIYNKERWPRKFDTHNMWILFLYKCQSKVKNGVSLQYLGCSTLSILPWRCPNALKSTSHFLPHLTTDCMSSFLISCEFDPTIMIRLNIEREVNDCVISVDTNKRTDAVRKVNT